MKKRLLKTGDICVICMDKNAVEKTIRLWDMWELDGTTAEVLEYKQPLFPHYSYATPEIYSRIQVFDRRIFWTLTSYLYPVGLSTLDGATTRQTGRVG